VILLASASAGTLCAADGDPMFGADEPLPLIRFAGGAIEFQLPNDWDVAEVPFGREVHMVLSPSQPNESVRGVAARIWLTCHSTESGVDGTEALQKILVERLAAVTRNLGKVAHTETIRIAGRNGQVANFTAKTPDGRSIRGSHLIFPIEGGLCEIHLVATEDEYVFASAAADTLLRTIAAPDRKVGAEEIDKSARDAKAVFGAWKAVASRLFLDGRGNIAIEFDRRTVLSVAAGNKPTQRITGSFKAKGDLLFVTWADGSKSNYRWRLERGELLLTDHDGNVSQLRRLVH
jgi:hypothetical protein